MPHCFEMGRAYERKHRIDGAILRAYGDQQGKKKIRHDASSIAQPFEATTRENFFVYLGCRGVIHTRSFYLLFMYYSLSLSLSLLFHLRASVAHQDRYQSVAEAFQAALQSLIHNPKFRYKDSFYYWGAFLPHGFADVQLDKQLLDQIHSVILQVARQRGVDTVEMEEDAIEFVMRALTREAHEDYDNREETMRVRLHNASEM